MATEGKIGEERMLSLFSTHLCLCHVELPSAVGNGGGAVASAKRGWLRTATGEQGRGFWTFGAGRKHSDGLCWAPLLINPTNQMGQAHDSS
jgi:hypothetical protein